jgi:Tfp pilus assembly protein PilP
MKKIVSLCGLIILTLVSVFLSGCGEDRRQRELRGYIANLKTTTANKAVESKVSQWQLPIPLTYHPGGSYSGGAPTPNAKNLSNPLQSYPVSELQFVGILTQNNQQFSAYIMTPDSMIYLVKVGDVIGEEYGKIIKIDSDHIELVEKVAVGNQPNQERIVTMELRDTP